MLAHKQEIACNGNGLGSPREIRPTVDIQSKAYAFATTHWSLVLTARVNQPLRKKPWKNFAGFIGDLCTLLPVDKVATRRKHEI